MSNLSILNDVNNEICQTYFRDKKKFFDLIITLFIFRKDWVLFAICLCVMGIGVPIICLKKYYFFKKIRKIPKPTIFTSQFLAQSQIFVIPLYVQKPQENAAKMTYNNTKSNKNIINFGGIAILSTIFIIIAYFIIISRFGGITVSALIVPAYIVQCCAPILLPTMYFIWEPKHLISVLKDLNIM